MATPTTTTTTSASATSAAPPLVGASKPKESIQDTLISVIIAFALAFVFRGFVVEAFVIPTGSMAPTLMGAHERLRSAQSGAAWPVGPWYMIPGTDEPKPLQGHRPDPPLQVHDPMTGEYMERSNVPRRSGDRILVLKYLYSLLEPRRFDVVVFKNPSKPEQNFIKRLIGLPGEQIAIVDGDIFVRRPPAPGAPPDSSPVRPGAESGLNDWALSGWEIARKPLRVQRAVWQPVFDSAYAPLDPLGRSGRWYTIPWTGSGEGWKIEGREYEYSGTGPTELAWDPARARGPNFQYGEGTWEIDDRYPYDETQPTQGVRRFPVSDIRMSLGVRAQQAGLKVSATITARGHDFQMDVADGAVTLRYRALGPDGAPQPGAQWTTLDTGRVPPIEPGRVVNLEFWHVDQALYAFVDGALLAGGPERAGYSWGPAQRIEFATGRTVNQWLSLEQRFGYPNVFAQAEHKESDFTGDVAAARMVPTYRHPRMAWSFAGSPVRLSRVSVDRDLHYQPSVMVPPAPDPTRPARGTHPLQPVILLNDQFFVCGDNSPASYDSRLWIGSEPWVERIDPTIGIVPRKLMLGKAFFVYFPSLLKEGPVPAPDFGRMRFIW